MSISENIKFYRKQKGLTQQELADKIGKSINSVKKYESGYTNPPIDVINKIAKALEINVIYLVEDKLKKESNSDSIISLLEERFSKLGNYDRKFATHFYEKFIDIFKPLATQCNLDDIHSIKFEFDKKNVNTLANALFKFYLENNLLTFEKGSDNPDTIFVYFKDDDNNTLNDSK